MIQLRDVLLLKHIDWELEAENRLEAIALLLQELRGDNRIPDFEAFSKVFMKHVEKEGHTFSILTGGLLLPHCRTDLVDEMLMAFGRLKYPIEDGQIQYIMLIAVPKEMESDYLRIVGGACRAFRASIESLNQCRTVREVMACLSGANI